MPPLSNQRLQELLAAAGVRQIEPYQEFVGPELPSAAPGVLREPGTMPATTETPIERGPFLSQKTRYALGFTDDPIGPQRAMQVDPTTIGAPMDPSESLAFLQDRGAPPEEQVPSRPAGGLPDVQGPGDLDRAGAERKIAQLTAFKDIAEGLGRPIPVEGDIRRGRRPQPFIAEGIRGAIGREEKKLGELDAADKLRLKAELEGQLMDKAAAQRAAQQAGGRQLQASDLKAFEGYQSFLTMAQDLLADSERMAGSLGPLDNLLDTAAEKLGWSSPEVAEFRRKATSQLNRLIREMTGAQMSEREAERIMRGAPKLTDTQQVFQAKMRGTIKEVKEFNNKWIENRRALGYDVPFQARVGGEGGDTVMVQIPGQPEKPIHRSQVPRLKEKYPDAIVNE